MRYKKKMKEVSTQIIIEKNYLAKIRKDFAMTQEELAEGCEIDVEVIQGLEINSLWATPKRVEPIAKYFIGFGIFLDPSEFAARINGTI